MNERYFLALLVALAAAGSLWLSFVKPVENIEVVLASLLALLGLLALANLNNAKSGALTLLFFIASILYSGYLFTSTGEAGILLPSIAIVSLLGLILSMGLAPKKAVAKAAVKKAKAVPASAKAAANPKKPSKKKKAARRRKK